MPHLAVLPPPSRLRARRSGRRLRPLVLGELALGLLLGAVGGWVAGLVRVRRPEGRDL